ncbi:MAG: hypothetical protein ACK5RG_02010 [Cyclobacteriaceae bacterium]|jgi:hypothetical protein|nr:hypothetical protein [Flammeovirgaceae bacterium]
MMKKPQLVIFAIIFAFEAVAQSTNIPLNDDVYNWLSRYEIKTGRIAPEWFTAVRTIKRDQAIAYLDSLQARDQVFTSQADQFNHAYFQNDSWEWSKAESSVSKKPFLKRLYGKKSDMGYVDEPAFDLHFSPVLHLGVGKDSRLDETAIINTRGVEVRGMIDKKIGFYTFITENQLILPSYVKENYFGVPHEGFVKQYKTTGFDFFQARAYIDFNITKHVYFQFGHDRTFIGNGYRSLVYSDHSPPNLFLKVNAKVWKINYLFQLNRLTANDPVAMTGVGSGKRYLDRYMALHHASINIGKKFNLGIFESIVFTPDDPVNRGTFDLSYLNPIIFYRAIEQQFGSSDNALLGLDFKWNAFKGISFYGQALLDEFVIAEIRAGNGWWGNKYAFQLGGKYIDVAGISNLDLQLEYNTVRPYTYSHNTGSSYSNYSQPLAHPLGANFNELVAIARYQPLPKLNLTAKMIMATVGRDGANENYGADVLKNYTTRKSEYGNFIGQGHKNDITFVDLAATYMLKHNVFLEVRQTMRKSECDLPFYNTNTSHTSLGLRWNIPARTYEF